MSDSDESNSSEWENLVEVGNYPTLTEAHEHGLVVLAMRQPCWVVGPDVHGGYTLHAEVEAAPAIARELVDYAAEQQQPSAAQTDDAVSAAFPFSAGWGVYGLWALTLILIHGFQNSQPWLADRAASSSIALIKDHEWWRPFTALFFHADVSHLMGNLLSGMFFGTLVARSISPLRAWALILASGTIGNALTSALTWPEPFVSIGSSTAVFGALGILSGLGFAAMLRQRFRLPWAKTIAPVLAGIVILGWLGGGTPGGNTDVLGHIFGFASGLTAGLAVGHFTPTTAAAWASKNAPTERSGLA